MESRLIVGLGNIGNSYSLTRHNVGFIFIDKVAQFYNQKFKESKDGLVSEFILDDVKVVLLKPTTYMNNSGLNVLYWKKWFKIDNSNILVLSDDLHLDIGCIRFRTSGSSGGHNGLKNIEQNIGPDYCRLKIGIGNNYEYGQQANFVLSVFPKEELEKILNNTENVIDLVDLFLKNSNIEQRIEKINNLLNKSD